MLTQNQFTIYGKQGGILKKKLRNYSGIIALEYKFGQLTDLNKSIKTEWKYIKRNAVKKEEGKTKTSMKQSIGDYNEFQRGTDRAK